MPVAQLMWICALDDDLERLRRLIKMTLFNASVHSHQCDSRYSINISDLNSIESCLLDPAVPVRRDTA